MADMKKELEIELEKINISLEVGNKVTIANSTDTKNVGTRRVSGNLSKWHTT